MQNHDPEITRNSFDSTPTLSPAPSFKCAGMPRSPELSCKERTGVSFSPCHRDGNEPRSESAHLGGHSYETFPDGAYNRLGAITNVELFKNMLDIKAYRVGR
jgi:hypothetical protein